MTNTTFKVKLNLATPVIMSRTRLTLDGLLSAAIHRKTGLKGEECIPHIPLEREQGLFKSSSMFIADDSNFSFVKINRIMSLRGQADLTPDHFLPNSVKGDRYLDVDQQRGRHKAEMSEYTGIDTRAVVFFGKGDAPAVKHLLETYVTNIGTRAHTGAGQVIGVECESLSSSDESYWVTESGQPARPIPVDIWKCLDGADHDWAQAAAEVTVCFPYWDNASKTLAVFPTEMTHF